MSSRDEIASCGWGCDSIRDEYVEAKAEQDAFSGRVQSDEAQRTDIDLDEVSNPSLNIFIASTLEKHRMSLEGYMQRWSEDQTCIIAQAFDELHGKSSGTSWRPNMTSNLGVVQSDDIVMNFDAEDFPEYLANGGGAKLHRPGISFDEVEDLSPREPDGPHTTHTATGDRIKMIEALCQPRPNGCETSDKQIPEASQGGDSFSKTYSGKTKETPSSDMHMGARQARNSFWKTGGNQSVFWKAANDAGPVGQFVTDCVRRCKEVADIVSTYKETAPLASLRKHSMLARIVSGNVFESMASLVIMANCGFISYSSNYAIDNLDAQETATINLSEVLFTVFYTIELVLRLTAFRLYFFIGPDYSWNIFDMCLVLSALGEQVQKALPNSGQGQQITFIRILRLLKMMKMLRVVRILRSFRELRLIMYSMMGSVKAMIWTLALILAITYVCGMAFMQFATSYLYDVHHGVRIPSSAIDASRMKRYWGSNEQSMLTLYWVSTGGVDWKDVGDSVQEQGGIPFAFLLFYVAFFMFVVVNSVTSIFIEATVQNAQRDQQTFINDEIKKKRQYVDSVSTLFKSIDRTGQGEISWEEFYEALHKPPMLAFFSKLELDVMDVAQFFEILSDEGQHLVDLETFITGCIKMRGTAKSMDLLGLVQLQTKEIRSHSLFREQAKADSDLFRQYLDDRRTGSEAANKKLRKQMELQQEAANQKKLRKQEAAKDCAMPMAAPEEGRSMADTEALVSPEMVQNL